MSVLTNKAFFNKQEYEFTIDVDGITWKRNGNVKGSIDKDDLIGAETLEDSKIVRVHMMQREKRRRGQSLVRKHKAKYFCFDSQEVSECWISKIKENVRSNACISAKRRVKLITNPHSGKGKALKIWKKQLKPLFDLVDIEVSLEETAYSGHAKDMGKSFKIDDGLEALIFVGGDGTICEYINGLLSRPEEEWRPIVRSTPLSLISAGTQNAFGRGMGIETVTTAMYSIIKRKIRPMDVITAIAHGNESVNYSCCGLGWGIAGDIAKASEKYRWLGTKRYAFLKMKYGIKPKKHTGKIKYIKSDSQPKKLCVYKGPYKNDSTENQIDAENEVTDALKNTASSIRYSKEEWITEEGKYTVIGAINVANDGKYSHPSDGNMDLVIARKGNIFKMLHLGILYLFGKELKSPLSSYIKVKAIEIEQNEEKNVMNIDGEVLTGPGPWRMEIVPSFFNVLSEK